MKVLVCLNQKIIGSITDGIFNKEVIKSRHFFRKYNGYAISLSTLEELRDGGVTQIRVFEKDTNKVFICNLDEYFKFGIEYTDKNDEQLVLSICHFTQIK